MKKFLISFTADYEEYLLKLKVIMPFSSEKNAIHFADFSVEYIDVSKHEIRIVNNNNTTCPIPITFGDFSFKRRREHFKMPSLSTDEICELKNNMQQSEFDSLIFSGKYFTIEERDYVTLDETLESVFCEMSQKYGYKERFKFEITTFSVKMYMPKSR